jgi:hypothetical protein
MRLRFAQFIQFIQFSPVPLGRWTRTDSPTNAIKVDWANTDHCGTCSLPSIPQLSQLPLIPMPLLDLKNVDEENRRMKRYIPVPAHRRAEIYRALTPVPRKAEAPVPSLSSPVANSVPQRFGWGFGNAMATTLMNARFPTVTTAVPAVPAHSLDDKEASTHLQ